MKNSSSCCDTQKPPDTVTHLIRRFRNGNDDAATALWDLYFVRMVGLARKQLGVTPRRDRDGEDLSAEFLPEPELRLLYSRWYRSAIDSTGFASFVLQEKLGEGSFGVVWKARDTDSGKTVAVKITHPGMAGSARQFFREAKAASKLCHPNIANIVSASQWKGRPYIVRDYVEGNTLISSLKERRFSPKQAAEMVWQLASALAYSHSLGCIHRDLKPGNVIIEPGGRPVLIDFGLAKSVEASAHTRSGAVMGTPVYMAPEQVRGDSHRADARTDVYSLGVILFELLVDRRPFEGGFEATMYQILHKTPLSPHRIDSTVPVCLGNICEKCLRKEPEDRYQSAEELAADLRRFLEGEMVLASPEGQLKRAVRFSKANPVIPTLAGCLLMTLLALTVVLFFSERSARKRWQRESHLRKQATEARNLAQVNAERAFQEAELSGQITLFLEKVFSTADPVSTLVFGAPGFGNPEMNAGQILDVAAQRIDSDLVGQRRLQARLKAIIGGVNCNLGRIPQAKRLLAEATSITQDLRTELTEKDFLRDTAVIQVNQGRLLHYLGEYENALECYRRSLASHEKNGPANQTMISELLLQIGWVYLESQKPEMAEPYLVRAWKLKSSGLEKNHSVVWIARLAIAHSRRDRLEFAAVALMAFLSLEDRQVAEAVTWVVIAQLAKETGYYQLAIRMHMKIIDTAEKRFGESSRWALLARGDCASTRFRAGFHRDALETIKPVIAIARCVAPDHPHMKNVYRTLAYEYFLAENYPLAIKYFDLAKNNPFRTRSGKIQSRLWLTEALVADGQIERAQKNLDEIVLQKKRLRFPAGVLVCPEQYQPM